MTGGTINNEGARDGKRSATIRKTAISPVAPIVAYNGKVANLATGDLPPARYARVPPTSAVSFPTSVRSKPKITKMSRSAILRSVSMRLSPTAFTGRIAKPQQPKLSRR